MNRQFLEQLFAAVENGTLPSDVAIEQFFNFGTSDLGEIRLDVDRKRRCGFGEVIYGEGKSLAQLSTVIQRICSLGEEALATRVAAELAQELQKLFPSATYNTRAKTLRVTPVGYKIPEKQGLVAVVTAGTTDLPVAEEACETLDWMAIRSDLIVDVGVAGPQRLLQQLPRIQAADCVIVVAGMEAALPSAVAGHVACPVIGVPTSVGYGANLGGFAALLSMINSCAPHVVVVNIDAGFKGGYVAGMIAKPKK
jgi:pyridinium-3,5-biscarboxylic acid mononucleotide synthase